jgi:phosphatidyl-myo-inositol dimannoside synthase
MDIAVAYDCLPKIGGAHTWLYEVYRRWPSKVSFYTARPSSDEAQAASERGFDAAGHGSLEILRRGFPLDSMGLLDPTCLRQLANNVRDIRRVASGPVRIHSLRAFPEGFTSYAFARSTLRRTTLITYAHGEEILISRTSRQQAFMTKRVYAASDLIIVNSENTRRLVEEICPDARIACIHPGVDAASFKMPADDVATCREAWGWPSDTVVLCTVARMELRKNHAAVIRALATLRAEGVPVAYICGGDGAERSNLEALARERGVERWVRFVGAVSDREKRLIFAAADIHIMASIQVGPMIEGFGIVFVEAAAAGKPSICGRSGGQAEAVREGVTGLVVDGTNDGEVAASIRKLALDAGMRRSMGEAGLAWAARNDWAAVTTATREAVEALARST